MPKPIRTQPPRALARTRSITSRIWAVVETSDRLPKMGKSVRGSGLGFGKKTYADGARQMVRVKINAGTSDWV